VIDGVRDVVHKLSDKLIENKDKFAEIYEKVKPFVEFLRDKVAPVVGHAAQGRVRSARQGHRPGGRCDHVASGQGRRGARIHRQGGRVHR
jgi:hypothetical protein